MENQDYFYDSYIDNLKLYEELGPVKHKTLERLIDLNDPIIEQRLLAANQNLELIKEIIHFGVLKYPREISFINEALTALESINAPTKPFLNALPSFMRLWDFTEETPISSHTIVDFIRDVVMDNPMTYDGRIVLLANSPKTTQYGSNYSLCRIDIDLIRESEDLWEVAIPYDKLQYIFFSQNHAFYSELKPRDNIKYRFKAITGETLDSFYTTKTPFYPYNNDLFTVYGGRAYPRCVLRKPFDLESISSYADC
jgi:hypothetical protein